MSGVTSFAYPVALDLTGRRCVVVGGGEVAVEKVVQLREAGAQVTLVSDRPDKRLVRLHELGALRLLRRRYQPGDLAGAFLAVVTREDPLDVQRVWEEAEAARVLMNVVDDVPHCHFAAMSILRRGDLRIAISTAGKAPALAKQLRRWLEDVVGPEWGELVEAVDQARRRALPRRVSFPEWSRRWGQALSDLEHLKALARAGRHEEIRDHLLAFVAPEEDAHHGLGATVPNGVGMRPRRRTAAHPLPAVSQKAS